MLDYKTEMMLKIGKIIAIVLAALVIFILAIGGPFRGAPRMSLTDAEKELQQKWRERFKCESIELRHDYWAIKEEKTNGVFTVNWCDDECRQDSAVAVKKAQLMARSLKSILSHRENYTSINFYSSLDKRLDERTSDQMCSLEIKLDAENMNMLEYHSHHNPAYK